MRKDLSALHAASEEITIYYMAAAVMEPLFVLEASSC
jgi:hypothetical protein